MEKVVKLLEEMKGNIVADGKSEEALYDTFSCWCTGMTDKKGKSIDKAKKDLSTSRGKIDGYRANILQCSTRNDEAVEDMKTSHEEQQAASEARDLENAAYTALRAEMGQAMLSLGQAVKMLTYNSAFLQTKSVMSTEAVEAVTHAIKSIPAAKLGALPAPQLKLLQQASTAMEQGTYSPSYGSIMSILEALNKQFTADLKAEEATETSTKKSFQDLMQTKVDQLTALQAKVDKNEKDKADDQKSLATETTNYNGIEKKMKGDITFFEDAYKQCSDKQGAWTERKKMRAAELDSVEKALGFLTSDDARALFATSIDASARSGSKKANYGSFTDFLQVELETMLPAQHQAFSQLKALATKSQSIALARIAAQVRLAQAGHFDAVLKSIDDVVKSLKTEQESDDAKKKQCKDEYQKVAKKSADETWEIEKNDAKINKLKTAIKDKEADIAETLSNIKDTKQQLADMAKRRADETDDYTKAKTDDENAIKVLKQAKVALNKFGKDNALVQGDASPDDVLRGESAPKAKFSDKKSRAGQTQGITLLLTNIIDGLSDELAVQKKVEEAAEADYQKAKTAAETLFKKGKGGADDTGDLETQRVAQNTAKTGLIADRDAEQTAKDTNVADLKSETDYKAKIQPDCDFNLNSWQERHDKRTVERDGLIKAKEFLSGAALVQTKKHSL